MEYLLELHQEIIALKLRVVKLEFELKKEKQKNELLEVKVEGEKRLKEITEEGFYKLVKQKDSLQAQFDDLAREGFKMNDELKNTKAKLKRLEESLCHSDSE